MDFGFLNLLYNFRYGENSNFLKSELSQEEKYFRKKYIDAAYKKNKKYGFNIEADYNAALSGASQREFMNGFKICLYFLMECLSPEEYKIES